MTVGYKIFQEFSEKAGQILLGGTYDEILRSDFSH